MKIKTLFISIFFCFLLASCGNPVQVSVETGSQKSAIDVIMTRTSVRSYTEKEIDDATVDTLLKAAMAAPSAVNKQPWAFVVVRDTAIIHQLAEAQLSRNPNSPIYGAKLVIAVCGDMEKALPDAARTYWVQDASAATENLLLAAHSLGLGAVWTGVYPMQQRVENVSKVLGLPGNILPLNLIPIGYPAENPEPKNKWDSTKVHYNKW